MKQLLFKLTCIVLLLEPRPSSAFLRTFCLRVRNQIRLASIENSFEIPEIKVEAERGHWGSRTIKVSGEGIPTLKGWEIPAPIYKVPSSRVERLFGIRTESGHSYTVIVLEENSPLLFPVSLHSYVLRFPNYFNRLGIWANKKVLIVPDCRTLNKSLDTSTADFRVGPRFEPHWSFFDSYQVYSGQKFLQYFAQGKVLVGIKAEYGHHDQLQEHLMAGLLLSEPVFDQPLGYSQLLEAIDRDPILRKEIPYQQFNVARDALAGFWDELTNEMARIITNNRTPSEKREQLIELYSFQSSKGVELATRRYWMRMEWAFNQLEALKGPAGGRFKELRKRYIRPTFKPETEVDRVMQALAI